MRKLTGLDNIVKCLFEIQDSTTLAVKSDHSVTCGTLFASSNKASY